MSQKISSFVSKSSSDRGTRNSKGSSHKSERSIKVTTQKKVLTSRKITPSCTESKSCSSGIVATRKTVVKPKKTTKSESTVTKRCPKNVVAVCEKCGDDKSNDKTQKKVTAILSSVNLKCVANDNNIKLDRKSSKSLRQYYKNENFHEYDETQDGYTIKNNKNISLDTIKEVSEMHTKSEDSIFRIYSDSEDDITYLDLSSDENIKKLKEFRQKNYFECHSAKSRIKTRASTTSLNNHKCVYRFYLNDRLFPVPLNTDYNNKIRCVECHLPMDVKRENSGEKINGTIQAKVKLGTNEAQDMLLLLPVKDSLIIEERRKENKPNNDYVYFGVVKLTADGNSMFNRTLPENSFALKYQKGYQEYHEDSRYNYKEIKDNDVIFI